MKTLGIVRNIDGLGRIVIPKEVRKQEGWEPGQPMEFFKDGNALVMKAHETDEQKENALAVLRDAQEFLGGYDQDITNELDEVIKYLKAKL